MSKEPFCKNCLLFDKKEKLCQVIILMEGEKYNLPTEPENKCYFDDQFQAINPETGKEELFQLDVKKVRMWMEDEEGNQADKGKVKIEYPDDFFGKPV